MFDEHLTEMVAIVSFSLGLFGAALCLMQTRDVWPYRALSFVLLVNCVIELEEVTWPISDPLLAARVEALVSVLWLIGITSLVPLFWHYVEAVTAVKPCLPKRLWLHLVLPVLAALLGITVMFMPRSAWQGLFLDTAPLPTGWPLTVGVFGELLVVAAVIQWGIYIVAIVRALLRYRARLHEYVASTAQRELGWVWVIICGFSFYWVQIAVDLLFALATTGMSFPSWFESVLGLIMLVIVLLWGLRQRPGLAPDVVTPQQDEPKYQKSALSPDMATRLERKLRRAMTDDKLQQDPNLSLWSLSRHIGASPNYVSQTLNDTIGESFFDFVNGYRISAAQTLLRETDNTVLQIAYDVGFNSRSSFYTAFNKVTGQTPIAYRKAMSGPD